MTVRQISENCFEAALTSTDLETRRTPRQCEQRLPRLVRKARDKCVKSPSAFLQYGAQVRLATSRDPLAAWTHCQQYSASLRRLLPRLTCSKSNAYDSAGQRIQVSNATSLVFRRTGWSALCRATSTVDGRAWQAHRRISPGRQVCAVHSASFGEENGIEFFAAA